MLKRIAAITLLATVAATPASAGEARQYQWAGTSRSTAHFIDVQTLTHSGDIVTGWVVAVPFDKTIKGQSVAYQQHRTAWDCKNRRYQTYAFIPFDEDGHPIEHIEVPSPSWSYVVPSSVGEIDLEVVCGEVEGVPLTGDFSTLRAVAHAEFAANAALAASD